MNVAKALNWLALSETRNLEMKMSTIKNAYLAKMKRVHPDVGGTLVAAQKTNEAYAFLVQNYVEDQYDHMRAKGVYAHRSGGSAKVVAALAARRGQILKKIIAMLLSGEIESPNDVWITGTYKIIKIKDMALPHLANAIKKMERDFPDRLHKFPRYKRAKEELAKRTAGAKVEDNKIHVNFGG